MIKEVYLDAVISRSRGSFSEAFPKVGSCWACQSFWRPTTSKSDETFYKVRPGRRLTVGVIAEERGETLELILSDNMEMNRISLKTVPENLTDDQL